MTAPTGVTALAGVTPDRATFAELAEDYAIVPVAVEVVADTLTPVAAFAALVGEAPGFLLESAEGDERWGRYSFVGANVLGTYLRSALGVARVTGALPAPRGEEGALAYLERVLAAYRTPPLAGLPPLHSGLVGLLAYDVVREIERLDAPHSDDLGHPDAAFHLIGELLAFDHWRQRLTVLVNVAVLDDGVDAALERYDAACARLDELVAGLSAAPALAPFELPPRDRVAAVATTLEPHHGGLPRRGRASARSTSSRATCSRWCSPSGSTAPSRSTRSRSTARCASSTRARTCTSSASTAARSLGSSPEALVRLRDGVATMRPIAGSRPRGGPRPRTSGSPASSPRIRRSAPST